MGRGRRLKIEYSLFLILLLATQSFSQTREFIGRNLCSERTNGTITDNLSCISGDDMDTCFPMSQLCNGVNDCSDGSDEGIDNAAILCEDPNRNNQSTFNCLGRRLDLFAVLCNGVDECGNGADEENSICDNKCLLQYYGGCNPEQQCITSRNSANCDLCVDGFAFIVDALGFGRCEILLNLRFNKTLVSGPEGGMAELCVILSYTIPSTFNITASVEVALSFMNGTAKVGIDFNLPTPSTFTLDSANPKMCVNVPLGDDLFVEGQEFFTAAITTPGLNPAQRTIGADASVLITDGDSPGFGFTAATYDVREVDLSLTVEVEIANNAVLVQDTVLYIEVRATGSSLDTDAIISGNNADLSGLPANLLLSVTFPANSGVGTTRNVIIGIVDDSFIEDDETFQLILRNASSAPFIELDMATVTILRNDDPIYEFANTPYEILEQDNTVNIVTLIVSNPVIFMIGSTVSRSVTVTSINGTAKAGLDFDGVNLQLTYSQTSGLSQTVPLTIRDDGIIEISEQFDLVARIPTAPAANPPAANATVTLLDDDLVLFSFEQLTQTVGEDVGSVQICVRLDAGILTIPVTVTLTFAAGTASNADFNDFVGTLTFDSTNVPGTASAVRCLNRAIVDDVLVERSETFTVTGSGANFTGGDTATITITDDDEAIFVVTPSTVQVAEAVGAVASVSVGLASGSGTLSFSIDVDLQTLSGTAVAGLDFENTATTLTFNAGSSPSTPAVMFSVPLIVNADVELQEEFNIQANIPADGTFSSGGTTVMVPVTIDDGDSLTIQFEFSSYTVPEGDSRMICLVRTNGMLASGVALTAHLSLAPAGSDPATADMDYNSTLVPEYVTFMSGMSTQCVEFTTKEDDVNEATETLSIMATSGNGSKLVISPDSADIQIIDDDLILFRFGEKNYTTEEGVSVQICVILVSGTIGVGTGAVTIDVSSIGGSATPVKDYTAISTTLSFSEGSGPGSQRCFDFTPINDTAVEYTEDIELKAVSARATFTSGGNISTIFIEDNNKLVVRFIPNGPINVPENVSWVQVCAGAVQNPIQLLERSVSFSISFKSGTATDEDPKDFQAKTMVYTITPATLNTVFCKNVTIIDDQICEFSEYFTGCLNAVSTGVVFKYDDLNITIKDNDVATIVGRNTYTVREGQDEVSVFLSLVGEKVPGRNCEVTWSTMDGTAVGSGPDPDFTQGGGTLTFTSDSASRLQSADITIINDRRCELQEKFQVFLSISGDGCQLEDGLSPINITIEDDDITAGGGDDPHFSIVLPSGKSMCFTVQGEHGFSFNLISNDQLTMNAKFVPDSRRSEVTWMGTMGIIVHHNSYAGSNMTKLRFEVSTKTVHIGDKMTLQARNIQKLTFKNGKLTITEAPPTTGYKVPFIDVDLEDVEVTFSMKFMKEHLDIYWHRTGMKITDSHGLIGQFFRKGVEIDEVRKILIMPNKEPVPVMRRPIWSFMERKVESDELCWTAMNPGYQGEGLIDGTYFDYLVDDVMSTDFKFSAKKN